MVQDMLRASAGALSLGGSLTFLSSSLGSSGLGSLAGRQASAAAFFSAMAAARSSFTLVSATRRFFAALFASAISLPRLLSILLSFSFNHLLNLASASLSEKAPFGYTTQQVLLVQHSLVGENCTTGVGGLCAFL